jgi:hypothetical protein
MSCVRDDDPDQGDALSTLHHGARRRRVILKRA